MRVCHNFFFGTRIQINVSWYGSGSETLIHTKVFRSVISLFKDCWILEILSNGERGKLPYQQNSCRGCMCCVLWEGIQNILTFLIKWDQGLMGHNSWGLKLVLRTLLFFFCYIICLPLDAPPPLHKCSFKRFLYTYFFYQKLAIS